MANKPKRAIACLMAAAMMAGVFSGCNNNNNSQPSATPVPTDNATPTATPASNDNDTPPADPDAPPEVENMNLEGLPIAKEKVTLKFVSGQSPIQVDLNETVVLSDFEEVSNVDIEWTCIPQEFLSERRNIIIASNDLPDAFYRCGFGASDIAKYAKQGQFVPITSYIENYCPNLRAWFEKYPVVKKGLTMETGEIHSLTYLFDAPQIYCGSRIFYNQDALAAAGYGEKQPETLDEFKDCLKKMMDFDINGNGQKDEIGLSSGFGTNTLSVEGLIYNFMGSWGLQNRGSTPEYVDVDPESGELRFIPTHEYYRELLQYLNSLYAEGLVDSELFTMDMPKMIAKGEDGRLCSYVFSNHTIIGTNYGSKSIGQSNPLKGPYGDQLWNKAGTPLGGVGPFAMTPSNKYPEITMRWIDYWYGDEGIRSYFMGVEGETYYVDENGDYQYTDFVMNNPDGIMFEQVLGKYVCWAGIGPPSVANEKYFKGGEMQGTTKESADQLLQYSNGKSWPTLLWNAADTEDMASIVTDLGTYIDEKRAQFISGQLNFDSDWDTYVKGFDALRVDRYLEIYKTTLDRYGLD